MHVCRSIRIHIPVHIMVLANNSGIVGYYPPSHVLKMRTSFPAMQCTGAMKLSLKKLQCWDLERDLRILVEHSNHLPICETTDFHGFPINVHLLHRASHEDGLILHVLCCFLVLGVFLIRTKTRF